MSTFAPDTRQQASLTRRLTATPSRSLQRKCACGGTPLFGGECRECREKMPRKSPRAEVESRSGIPVIVRDVLQSPGHPLDAQTRATMETRFSEIRGQGHLPEVGPLMPRSPLAVAHPESIYEQQAENIVERMGSPHNLDGSTKQERPDGVDFGEVRIHTDELAHRSADSMNAQAYTVGNDIVFARGKSPPAATNHNLLVHELTHVLQQSGGNSFLARTPNPETKAPRTFIFVYGTGQVNPTTNDHNVGEQFRIVAAQKLKETKARLGDSANQHTFVLEYTPTEAELTAVLNQPYSNPVAEVHIFSHGWEEGANLGGPAPANRNRRPTVEAPAVAEERRLTKTDFDKYKIAFADDAVVTFYGCNIGNVRNADDHRPLAQDFSDAFGVRVNASTTSTHFEEKNRAWHQVPDAGGRIQDFAPSEQHARARVEAHLEKVLQLKELTERFSRNQSGLLGGMVREERLAQQSAPLRAAIAAERPIILRLIRFLPTEEGNAALRNIFYEVLVR